MFNALVSVNGKRINRGMFEWRPGALFRQIIGINGEVPVQDVSIMDIAHTADTMNETLVIFA